MKIRGSVPVSFSLIGYLMRETVRSISDVSVRILRSVTHSTRGPVVIMPMVYQFFFQRETLSSYAWSG